jgi:hypothetical protein
VDVGRDHAQPAHKTGGILRSLEGGRGIHPDNYNFAA